MKDASAYLAVAFVCLLVLSILFFKNKVEFLIRLVLRGVVGSALIYIADQALISMGIGALVGVNPVTVLTSVILGIPGVCALFFIAYI